MTLSTKIRTTFLINSFYWPEGMQESEIESGIIHIFCRISGKIFAGYPAKIASSATKDNTVNRLNMSIGFIVIDRLKNCYEVA